VVFGSLSGHLYLEHSVTKEESMKLKSPCVKECPSRAPGCRTTCKQYLEYEERRMVMYEEKNERIDQIFAARGRWDYEKRNAFYRKYRKRR
jgi:hypothetical protein